MNINRIYILYLLLLAGVLGIGGCANGFKQVTRVEPFLADLQGWPDMYRQNFEMINSFHGRARLSVESEDFSGNVNLQTYWIAPEKLFLKAEGPLGLDVGKIFVGPQRFIWYNQYQNYFTSGSVEDPYLNRFLQTNFTFEDLKYTVLGYAGQVETPPTLADEHHGVFVNEAGDIQYQYVVNPRSGLLESCQASRNERPFLLQEFKNYRVINGIYFPMLIRITMLDQKERISIFYKEIEINQPIDPMEYTIEISAKVQQLNVNQ